MTDLPPKLDERRRPITDQLDEFVIEAVSEQEIREARERKIEKLRLLWAQRRMIGRAMVWALVATAIVAFLIPKRYQAVARLMPPDEGSGSGAALLAAVGRSVGGGLANVAQQALGVELKTSGDLFIGILQSDTVRDDLIHKFNLQRLYHDRHIEAARDDLASHTDIAADPKSGIITLKVIDHSAKRSAEMVDEYINELNWVVNNLSTSSAHKERVFLDQRLAEVKGNLESSEKQFSQFASQKDAMDIPMQGRAMLQTAAALQGQLIAAESELQGLRQIYTDNNARVRSLEARVNELRAALERIGGANANESSSAQELYPSLRQLPLLGVTYADLLRRTKVEEAVFETLTQEDELAKVQEAKEIPSVKILDAPEVPDEKSFPPRPLIICLGTLLTGVFCSVWIIAQSAWEKVDASDARKTLAVEIWSDVRRSLPWSSRNGLSKRSESGRNAP